MIMRPTWADPLAHGNSFSKRSWFHWPRKDFPVLGIDLRHHGQSDKGPSPVSFGFRESEDVVAAVKWLQPRCSEAGIGLWGESMGGTTALHAAIRLQEEGQPIQALAMDSAFLSLRVVVEEQVGPYLAPFLVEPWTWWFRSLVGSRDLSVEMLQKLNVPVLMTFGQDDSVVPPSYGYELYRALCGTKRSVVTTVFESGGAELEIRHCSAPKRVRAIVHPLGHVVAHAFHAYMERLEAFFLNPHSY